MQELSLRQLASAIQGAIVLEDEGGAILVRRFGAKTMAYWGQSEAWAIRSRCPAGVRLAFSTDAAELRLAATVGAFSRQAARFDCYVDDVCTASVGSDDGSPVDQTIPLLGTGTRRVDLWLPQMRIVTSLSVSLSDGAAFEPAERGRVWLAMGDSITQGMETPFPSLCYPAVAARAAGLSLHNCGVGGAVFDAASIPEPPLDCRPDAITVAFGVNDWNRGSSAEPARGFLQRLRGYWPDVPMAVFEPLWCVSGDADPARTNSAGQTYAQYRGQLRKVAESIGGLTWVPRERLVPPGPAPLIDNCHPNTAGFAFYGQNVAIALRRLLVSGAQTRPPAAQ